MGIKTSVNKCVAQKEKEGFKVLIHPPKSELWLAEQIKEDVLSGINFSKLLEGDKKQT